MKVFNVIWKILVAVAAIAGIAYVAITYGDKISAWIKEKIGCCCCACECDCEDDCKGDCDCECKCECVGEAPTEEIAAEDTDFEN